MSTPFEQDSIGIAVYLPDLPADRAVAHLVNQAVIADRCGFDGVSVSEHHAGFPGYVPNPLLAAAWMLEATDRVWCGPVPLLLPLRNAMLVAEDLAWLAARHPGRVGAGVAPGYQESDFAALVVDGFDERGTTHERHLGSLVALLRGHADGALVADFAMTQMGEHPVPLVSAAGSLTAARRAGRAQVGLLVDSMTSDERLHEMIGAYRAVGGSGPIVMGRRVWLGDPPRHLFDAMLDRYRSAGESSAWLAQTTSSSIAAGDPDYIATELADAARRIGATALNVRVYLPGVDPSQIDEQIEGVGEVVLPLARRALAERPRRDPA